MPLSFEEIFARAFVDATHYRLKLDGGVRYFKKTTTGQNFYRDENSGYWIWANDDYTDRLPLRPKKSSLEETVFMEMTTSLAKLSKCVSLNVASLLVDETGRTVATGVNGTPSGYSNCCDLHEGPSAEHSEWSLDHEIHAEMNMILDLARSGKTFKKGKIFVTHSPCQNCLKHLIGLQQKGNVEITDIIFKEKYYKVSDEALKKQIDFASKFKVNLRLHVPSGK